MRSLLLALLLCACAADPVLLPDSGPCSSACGAGTVCRGGACVAVDAGSEDAPQGTDAGGMKDAGGADGGFDARVEADAARSEDAGVDPGRVYDFVINRMIVGEGAEPGVTTRPFYGFNLDGRYSPSRTSSQVPADCAHGDYFSAIDPDQNMGSCAAGTAGGGVGCQGGVDNQLPNLAQTIMQFQASLNVEASLNERIASGRGLVLIRVSGVDGALGPSTNDAAVMVRIYPFVSPLFADCAGVARAGEMYAIDNRSLATPGDIDSALIRMSGSIVNGRLHTGLSAMGFSVLFGSGDTTVSIGLRDVRVRFSLSDAAGTAGNLGGHADPAEIMASLDAVPALRGASAVVRGFVDVATGEPSASCAAPNGSIGMGLGFTAVRALVSPLTVSGAAPGMCGAIATP